MQRFDSPLNNIRVASPCSANWDGMYGDERKRFCGECKLNVYNLSGMTHDEAEDLIAGNEGRLCVRFFRRMDGSVITQNCPVGWARVKQRARVFTTAVFSMILGLLGGLSFVSMFTKTRGSIEVGELTVTPTPTPRPKQVPLMGEIARPSPTPTPKSPSQAVVGQIAMPERGKIAIRKQ